MGVRDVRLNETSVVMHHCDHQVFVCPIIAEVRVCACVYVCVWGGGGRGFGVAGNFHETIDIRQTQLSFLHFSLVCSSDDCILHKT